MSRFITLKGPKMLYQSFKQLSQKHMKALILNFQDSESPHKIAMFDINIQDIDDPSVVYLLEISYVMPSEIKKSQGFVTYDLKKIADKRLTNITNPARFGLDHPRELLLQFLTEHNLKTGTLKKIKATSNKDSLEPSNFEFYADLLRGKTSKVSHKGNAEGRWKYYLTKEEEKQIIEVFASMFRDVPDINKLNLVYGEDWRAQYDAEFNPPVDAAPSIRTSSNKTNLTDDEAPSF